MFGHSKALERLKPLFNAISSKAIWGCWRQKQVSQAGISNCIQQNTVGCNYLFLPEIPVSGIKVYYLHWIRIVPLHMHLFEQSTKSFVGSSFLTAKFNMIVSNLLLYYKFPNMFIHFRFVSLSLVMSYEILAFEQDGFEYIRPNLGCGGWGEVFYQKASPQDCGGGSCQNFRSKR